VTRGISFPKELSGEIRDQFFFVASDPLEGDRIFLDSASGSLRLKSMVEALAAQSAWPDQLGRQSPGSKSADQVMDRGIEDVRAFLGAESGVIMPGMSSTHAIFRVVNAVLSSAPGTNVITTNLEHPAVYDATSSLADAYDREWRVAGLDPETGLVAPDAILDLVDARSSLIAMIHGSNITGAVLDVARVAREARQICPDVLILVDGVQYAPHAPVNVDALGIDAYVFGPYKAFGPKGIGFAYLSDRLNRLTHWKLRGKPTNDWTLGSPEDATYAAWSAVVRYLQWLGSRFTTESDRQAQISAAMKASELHVRALLDRLLNGSVALPGLREMDHVVLHGATGDLSDRLCLALLSLEGADSHRGVELYRRAGIRVHNRVLDAYSAHTLQALEISEGIRVSACHYNTADEIDRFLEATARIGEMPKDKLAEVTGAEAPARHGEG
jgi:cysteine desulfurase/selenocysteine lyase